MDTTRCAGADALDEWLKRFRVGREEVATAIGVSRVAVHGYLAGDYRPEALVRERIERFTNGAVTAESWMTDAERSELAQLEPFEVARDRATDAARSASQSPTPDQAA